MYPLGKTFTWHGPGVHLIAGIVQVGEQEPVDPVARITGELLTTSLHHFIIRPISGAFKSGRIPGHLYASHAFNCIQHYLEGAEFIWLKTRILKELTNHSHRAEDLTWRINIIPWRAKNGEMGEAISIISGTAKDMTQLDAKLAEETEK